MKIINRPMAAWDKAVTKLPTQARMDLLQELGVLTIRAARLEAYLYRRHAGGKHADAVKAQNQVARRVRQALGYTYADDAIHF